MSYTFDSTALINPGPLKPMIINDEVFEITIDCMTEDYADITAIKAKAGLCKKTILLSGHTCVQTTGTKGTLVLGSDSYTNCAIEGGVQVKEIEGTAAGAWKYSMKFVQDTS